MLPLMNLSSQAADIYNQINTPTAKLGDLRSIAKDIKRDHHLAMELWSTGAFMARQLAILIMDAKQLSQAVLDRLDQDMQAHPPTEQTHLMDWLMANQLSKDKKTIALMASWAHSPSLLQRRTYWYYQARLRWMGKIPVPNTNELMDAIEARIENEAPEVQWAMNFTAAQIGVFQPEYRQRCIALSERTGLYRDEIVPRGCTPSYLPAFIEVQVAKM
jgi:3-methyladenine DNA glycosylase AlkD